MSQILNEPLDAQPGSGEPPRDHRPSPRRSPAWPPSARGLVAAAAAVALVAGLGVTAADRFSAHPAAPTASATSATVVLDRIAQAASARPAVKVGPKQYFYVKAKVVSSSRTAPSGTVQGWVAQSQSKETLWRANRQSQILKTGTVYPGFGGPLIGMTIFTLGNAESRDKLLYPTYAYLESLPTNPRQLLTLIEQQNPGDRSMSAFILIGQLLSTAVLPPRTAAALYRAAALIPGVTVVPGATDALGRSGIGISLSNAELGSRLRQEWIFSTSTDQFLGARTWDTNTWSPEVTRTSASAVLARGVANSPGGTPTLIKP